MSSITLLNHLSSANCPSGLSLKSIYINDTVIVYLWVYVFTATIYDYHARVYSTIFIFASFIPTTSLSIVIETHATHSTCLYCYLVANLYSVTVNLLLITSNYLSSMWLVASIIVCGIH